MNDKDKDFPFDVILYKSDAAFFFGEPIKNTQLTMLAAAPSILATNDNSNMIIQKQKERTVCPKQRTT